MLLERGDFKLSIGGLNSHIPYTVQEFIGDFAIGMVVVKSRFQDGTKSESKDNVMSSHFSVN